MAGPIKPKDVATAKATVIPEEVYEAFNELIVKFWTGTEATITFKEAVSLVATKLRIPASEVCTRKYMDIEDIYKKAGWVVVYDQPGYNETGNAFYTFSKKRTRTL